MSSATLSQSLTDAHLVTDILCVVYARIRTPHDLKRKIIIDVA